MGRFAPALTPVPSSNGHKPTRSLRSVATLTASADAAAESVSAEAATAGRSGQGGWQNEAWPFHDNLPELHYGTQFTGSCYSRIVLRLGWKNDAGDIAACFNEDDEIDQDCDIDRNLVYAARGVLHAIQDPLGGQAALLENIGKNMTMAGELHLVARDYHDIAGTVIARRWEVLSTSEIRKKTDVKYDKETGRPLSAEFERVVGNRREDIPPDCFVLRIYRRHPRWSHQADAATRPLLETMELLVLLTRQLRATVLSRLAGAGVLFVPSEIDFSDDETAPEGSEEDDPFARQLIKAMTAPITNRGSPASVVPFVVRADADLIPAISHLVFDSKDDDTAIAKMDALLLRFAQGMDLPMEVIMGHQSTTFANAVQIDESTFKAHLEPSVNLVCGFLTAGYLWPSLGAPRPVDVRPNEAVLLPIANDPITRLVIYPDASALITHEHREENAVKALQMKPPLISKSSGRRALGFTDADAPDDDELTEWITVQQAIAVKETIRGDLAPGTLPGKVDVKALDPAPTVAPGADAV